MSLYENINKRKKAGTSRSKSNSTITKKNYDNMKKGFKKKGGFPDNNKDGEITQADIYLQKKKTGTIKKKGGVKDKMGMGGKKMMSYGKGGKKKMMGGGMKKMMYKSGGFLEPKIPNIDDL
tara:strand:+ start:2036 stop:2398 length:363 start_codon:yes stop_codon:yes gene_type:complete